MLSVSSVQVFLSVPDWAVSQVAWTTGADRGQSWVPGAVSTPLLCCNIATDFCCCDAAVHLLCTHVASVSRGGSRSYWIASVSSRTTSPWFSSPSWSRPTLHACRCAEKKPSLHNLVSTGFSRTDGGHLSLRSNPNVLCPWAEREDRHDLLHSRLLPLHHQGARGAGQGPLEQHGEHMGGQRLTCSLAETKSHLDDMIQSFGDKMTEFCVCHFEKSRSTCIYIYIYIFVSHKLNFCPNSTKFQPEGEKLIVSSFSDPIRLICPPEVRAAFQSSAPLITPAAFKK